ncbi:MAG: hypothetical protein NVSMB46_04820 [Candidatus Saccharimonadales bacterium]
MSKINNRSYSKQEIAELEERLEEAESVLQAIREGSVDALVMNDNNSSQQIFTLKSADYSYRILIESMSQGAITLSEDGIILYSNQQFGIIVGCPLEKVIGQKLINFINHKDMKVLEEILRQGSANPQGSEQTVRIVGGSAKEVMISARRLQGIDENAYMCLVVTDMTERNQVEHAKDEFISLASHQLRTPATGVKQYVGMLLEGYGGNLTEKQRMFAQTAYDSNERQLSIINSILKTAQIDFGAYKLKNMRTDLGILVTNSIKELEPMLIMREQKVICEFNPDVYAMVEQIEFSLVISNLIENASKYSPKGESIVVKVYKKGGYSFVEVIDKGVGIPKKYQTKIFEKFTRVDNVLSDTVSGSGLGLYWVKKIVELHKGQILLRSVLNVGSTFTVKLKEC